MPSALRAESRDVDPRSVLLFAGALVVFLLLVAAGLYLVFGRAETPPAFGSGVDIDGRSVPLVQPSPRADRAAFDAEKHAALESLGWIDRNAGIAHIPIGEAMRLLAGKGAAGWSDGPAAASGPCGTVATAVPRAPPSSDCRSTEPPGGG
jgi:hypothetical protein